MVRLNREKTGRQQAINAEINDYFLKRFSSLSHKQIL